MCKKIGIILLPIVTMFLVTMLAVFLKNDKKVINRVQQHIESAKETEQTAGLNIQKDNFATHLPIVSIETNEKIPGDVVIGADGQLLRDNNGHLARSLSKKTGLDVTTASMEIIDNTDGVNRLSDTPTLKSKIRIHVHGNTSKTFDKKSYKIDMVTDSGKENRQSVMGMDEHDEWILFGSALDKTLIRTYMWYNIAGQIMDYAPNVRFCEVFLNGKYIGVYLMEETVTNGKDSRVDITEPIEGSNSTGYILRLDRGSNKSIKNISTFTQYTYRSLTKMNIVYPGEKLTQSMADSISQEFSDFEKCLYSYDYDTNLYGYENYIDTDSWVDYYVLNEFMCNADAGKYSTYIYKDISEKYKMCIWDLDSIFDNYQVDEFKYDTDYNMSLDIWFFMLFKDEDFTNKVIERYKKLRQTYLSDSYMTQYAQQVREYLGEAIDRNYKVWGDEFGKNGLLIPASRNPRNYDESFEQYTTFMKKRGAFMDETIDTLMQFCHESKVKRYNP